MEDELWDTHGVIVGMVAVTGKDKRGEIVGEVETDGSQAVSLEGSKKVRVDGEMTVLGLTIRVS